MSLENIIQQVKKNGHSAAIPPVEDWDPDYCSEMDLVIKSDGSWYHQGTVFKRLGLVKLLASVLKKEASDYFLVTPVEKIKIKVEKLPFVVTQWHWQEDEGQRYLVCTTNLDEQFVVSENQPVTINNDGELSVIVRRNLCATIHRNVYYQWIEEGHEETYNDKTAMCLTSGSYTFPIGYL
jgi:uncharacterized protein